jgi:hypothetical protein
VQQSSSVELLEHVRHKVATGYEPEQLLDESRHKVVQKKKKKNRNIKETFSLKEIG